MKFRFYIIDYNNDSVNGTNDEETAKDFAEDDELFIIDIAQNLWLLKNEKVDEIEEI